MKLIRDGTNALALCSLEKVAEVLLNPKQLDAIREAIVLQNPVHIWAVNPQYQLIYMNILFHNYIEDQLGISLRLGDNVLELPLSANIIRNWREHYDTALAGESLLVNEKLNPQSGNRNVNCQLAPLRFQDENQIWGVIAFGSENTFSAKIQNQMLKYKTLYRQAEKLMNIGFAEWDIEKGELTPHESWLNIHGVSKEKLTFPELMQLAHPEDAKQIECAIEKTLSETKPYNIEHRIIRNNDGQIRVVKALGEVLKAANGEPVKVYSIVQDITEMRSLDDHYRENLEKYKQLFELISDAIFLIDNETGNILEANKTASSMYGYSHEELIALKNTSLSAEPDRTRCATGHRLKSIPVRYHRKKDGSIFPVEITASHYEFNGRPVHIAAIRDISERLHKETELKQSEANYRTIFNAANNAIFVLDAETNLILEANEKAFDLFGYSPKEDVELRLTDLIRFRQECSDRIWTLADIMEQTKQGLEYTELLGRTKSGTWRWLELNLRKIKLRERNCLLVIISDISKRKHLESQLIQSQKTEALGTLAGGIAHDFNNIIASITGYTELMLRNDYSFDKKNKYLDHILKGCERAKNLVNQILLFGSHQQPQTKPVDLRLIVKEALQLLRASIKPSIEIDYQTQEQDSVVSADATQIHQVVMNLCTNAAHAMEHGFGLITVSIANQEISTESASEIPHLPYGSYVHLRISDNGRGIDPSIIGEIFDPFFTTKKAGKGTGLGLAIVKNIVKKHGGFIFVQSKLGEGATFDIYLPQMTA